MILIKSWLLFISLLNFCYADCYFQNPRGSNNRLNEKSANRRNANRVFDSQVSKNLRNFVFLHRGIFRVFLKMQLKFTQELFKISRTTISKCYNKFLKIISKYKFLKISWFYSGLKSVFWNLINVYDRAFQKWLTNKSP